VAIELHAGPGLVFFEPAVIGRGLFVSPCADAADVAAREVRGRKPRDLQHAADLLRRIVGRQIEHEARTPTRLLAAGPVHILALLAGCPPRFLREEAA
jgi:hypothetical protein